VSRTGDSEPGGLKQANGPGSEISLAAGKAQPGCHQGAIGPRRGGHGRKVGIVGKWALDPTAILTTATDNSEISGSVGLGLTGKQRRPDQPALAPLHGRNQ
jgi:hypothetical protein